MRRTWALPGLIVLSGGAALMATGCAGVVTDDTLVRLIPFSGRFGYGLEGPYRFRGSLTKERLTDANWHMEGEFAFPTPGYCVKRPRVWIAESFPEQVTVKLIVVPPPEGSVLPQVVTNVSIETDIPASNQARFAIHVMTVSQGGLATMIP